MSLAAVAVPQRMVRRVAAILLCSTTVAFAGPPSVNVSETNGAHWTQFMLYVGTSVGGGSGAHPSYGFRVEQIHIRANTESLIEGGSEFQHRELMNWRMQRGSDFRVQLGRNVTWNASRGAFERALASAVIVPTFVAPNRATTQAWKPRSIVLGAGGTRLSAAGASPLSSPNCVEIAAAAASAWSGRQRAWEASPRSADPAVGTTGRGGRRELATLVALSK